MGRRSLKNTARAGAARAVVGEVATRATQTARSSASAAVALAATTGRAGARVARSSVSAAADLGASTGRAGAALAKRVSDGLASTVRTATSNDDALWADQRGDDSQQAPQTQTQTLHDQTQTGQPGPDAAVAALRSTAERAEQQKAAAVRAAADAGAGVTEIARAAGESRRQIKDWLTGP